MPTELREVVPRRHTAGYRDDFSDSRSWTSRDAAEVLCTSLLEMQLRTRARAKQDRGSQIVLAGGAP